MLLNKTGRLRGARGVLRNLNVGNGFGSALTLGTISRRKVFMRKIRIACFAGVFLVAATLGPMRSAQAFCIPCISDPVILACMCILAWADERTGATCMSCPVTAPINQHFGPIQNPIEDFMRQWHDGELGDMQEWMLEGFFEERLLPAMMQMTLQLSSVMMYQIAIVGKFLDAKHQMETQRLFQYMNAQTFKDYYPSEGLCTIGTVSRSIQVADHRLYHSASALSQFSIRRQLLNINSSAATGPTVDMDGRWRQFRENYCDIRDNNNTLEPLCGSGVEQLRRNMDVDYSRTFGVPITLDLDFSNDELTNDEEDLMALMSNMYSHRTFAQLPAWKFNTADGRSEYMDMRSIVAKRSVAEQSMHAIASLKTPSPISEESREYLLALMQEAGISEEEADLWLTENTSYLAQMDLIARKLFQRPEFYVDLMDKPANVARKSVALQTVSLMQKRELFKSALRSEALISIILELELIQAQNRVQNEAARIRDN
jgi:hypothetical protein